MKTKEVQFTYDAFDRRISKSIDDDGNGTFDRGAHYVYDGSDIVFVFDDAGAMTERLPYGPNVDQVLGLENESGDVAWMLPDHQGRSATWPSTTTFLTRPALPTTSFTTRSGIDGGCQRGNQVPSCCG